MSALEKLQLEDLDQEQQEVAEVIGLENDKQLMARYGGTSILALTFCLGTALLLTSPQLGEFYLSSRLREGMNSKLIHPYFEAAASGVRIFGAILCCGSALFAYRYLFERRDSVQN